jgi:hypothetical protein
MPDDIDYGHADQVCDQICLAVPLTGPVRRILEITGLDRQFQLYPTACHAAAGPPVPAPRPARR